MHVEFLGIPARARRRRRLELRRTRSGQLLVALATRFPSLGELITADRLQPSIVANLNGDRVRQRSRHATRQKTTGADPVRRRRGLDAMRPAPFGYHGCYLRIDVSTRQRRARAAAGDGAAAVPRRQRAGRLAAARRRRARRRSAGAGRAARLRVQPAGRQPAHDFRQVRRRQQEPADRADQRLARQQRLRDCRQALRLRRDRDRRTGRRAVGADHRRRTTSGSSRPTNFAARPARRPKRR